MIFILEKVLFSSPLLVSLGSQDRNIDHKWRVFQGYDISPKRITVWLTHHISLESPVFYRISIFISIQFLLQSIKPSVATCEARIMEEKTWNRLKVGIENRRRLVPEGFFVSLTVTTVSHILRSYRESVRYGSREQGKGGGCRETGWTRE